MIIALVMPLWHADRPKPFHILIGERTMLPHIDARQDGTNRGPLARRVTLLSHMEESE